MDVAVTVNGVSHRLDVEPRLLLVDLLRDELGLTGTKVGCDTGQCGACVVLMDGVSVKSCALLGVQATDSDITTVEGIAPIGHLDALQAGFQAMHAVQCGFCTPGMLVSLGDLMARQPDATDADVRQWLAGNLCRCTGYENVVRAFAAARSIAASPAHQLPDTAHKVFYDRHLQRVLERDPDAVGEDYTADAVLTTFEGVHAGRAAIVAFYRDYFGRHFEVEIMSTDRFVEMDDAFYVEATVRSGGTTNHVYNSFVIRDGQIDRQFAGVK
jgi:carbon-monoxide dehydrogenase small subunit